MTANVPDNKTASIGGRGFSLVSRRRAGRLLAALLSAAVGVALVTWPRAADDAWLAEAQRLSQLDRLEDAITVLDDYVASQPDSPRGHFLLARALRRAGSLQRAGAHLDEALRLGWNRDDVERQRLLAAAQAGDHGSSEPYLAGLLEQGDPHPEEIYEAWTLWALESQHRDAAQALVQRWLEAAPDSIRARMIQAWGFESGHRWKQAEQEYRSILERDPEHLPARRNLGRVLIELNRPEEARREYEWCRQRDGGEPETLAGLARSLDSLEETTAALALLEDAASRYPENVEFLVQLGTLQWELERLKEAERTLRSALSRAPHEIEARYKLSQVLQRLGATDEARQHADAVEDLRSRRARLAEIVKELAHEPGDTSLRYEAAMLTREVGSVDDAVLWLRSILLYDPWHRRAHRALAAHFEQAGNHRQAAAHRARASAAPPRTAEDQGAGTGAAHRKAPVPQAIR